MTVYTKVMKVMHVTTAVQAQNGSSVCSKQVDRLSQSDREFHKTGPTLQVPVSSALLF